jgi:hypothetical protein
VDKKVLFAMAGNKYLLSISPSFRQLVFVFTAILAIFGGIFLTLIHVYSLPEISVIPIAGDVFYLLCALALITYFILEWRKESCIETKLINEPDLQGLKIVVVESASEKILRWIISIVALIFVVISLGFVLICVYGIYKGSVQPQTNRLVLGELILIATAIVVFFVWKRLSVYQR